MGQHRPISWLDARVSLGDADFGDQILYLLNKRLGPCRGLRGIGHIGHDSEFGQCGLCLSETGFEDMR